MEPLRIGLVGTYAGYFDRSAAGRVWEMSVAKLRELTGKMGLDFCSAKDLITNREEAEKVRKEIEDRKIDLLLVQTTTFGSGEIIEVLAGSSPWLGLWAVPESRETGTMPLNSLCGVNFYGAVLSTYLKRGGFKFKWFYGNPDQAIFEDSLLVTLRALNAIKLLRQSRIANIGGIPGGYYDVLFDQGFFRTKFGVTFFTHEIGEVVAKANSYDQNQVAAYAEKMAAEVPNRDLKPAHFEKLARIYLALEDMVKENNYQAIAVCCWPRIQSIYGVALCSTLGRLNENGIVAACEGDVPSALSMLLLNYLNADQSILMDMSKLDPERNRLMLWHCGVGNPRWASKRKGAEIRIMPLMGLPAAYEVMLVPQVITITRITGDAKRIFLASGKLVEDPDRVHEGTSGWLEDLRILDQSVSALDFVNTVMVSGFEHHFPLAKGDLCYELNEIASWLDLEPIKPVLYRPYLQRS